MEEEFFPDDGPAPLGDPESDANPWRILIVDDEPDVHRVTRLAMDGIRFRDRPIDIISAYSAREALDLLRQPNDIAMMLLDVVMESDHAGLECARAIREDLGNHAVRIVLRTGQPGQAPERAVIEKYDINDYRAKTELTRDKLYTAVVGNLRSYEDLMAIERARRIIDRNRRGLVKIVESSAFVFQSQAADQFAEGVLEQLRSLIFFDRPAVLLRGSLSALSADKTFTVMAGLGHFQATVGEQLHGVVRGELAELIARVIAERRSAQTENYFVGYVPVGTDRVNVLVVEGDIQLTEDDHHLLALFCRNVGIAYENALLQGSLATRTQDLERSQAKLAELVRLGIALSAEKDSVKLLDMLLSGAKDLANSDGGTLYLRTEENQLAFQLIRNDSLKIAMGGTSGAPINFPPVPMFEADGQPNRRNVVSHAVNAEETVRIDDAYLSTEFDFSGTRAFDQRTGYRSRSFLTVPLKPRGGDVIGALQLINARAPDGETVVPFSDDVRDFVEALAAQAATAIYNRRLLDDQEKLMDALVRLIVGAIDAKSPYTGGHCTRVPELAFMLAEEAEAATEGPFKDFAFANDEEWREFRLGALLHDCGKVTTPEYIVDKATKLETIYNRIHEVRTRFEILLRDAEIAMLRDVMAGGDRDAAEKAFADRKEQLTADFAFVAECNLGAEFLSADKIARLRAIGETTWTRHFSERLGLAHGEMERFADLPEETLPVEERLLADKPQHRIPRHAQLEDVHAKFGFKMAPPEFALDLGELHNLSIQRGTLTAEERFRINDHIIQTIMMLETLPLPKSLKRLPEYAGTHHETLTGSGYPRKLTADELSVPSRIMAVADIFEALTASDRPYKQAKTLSEAIVILDRFQKDRHIDPDLFRLFLERGIHRRYAERFLNPRQIDDVDLTPYLS